MSVRTLFRPVGAKELALIEQSGFRRFPPRLPDQPIFYPVCNERYACEIAERWNVSTEGGGWVMRFDVREEHLLAYAPQIVGARHHEEYWIPAEKLTELNDAIVGPIVVVRSFAAAER